jgi:DNA-binding MarR family transcriptional regulator
MRSTHVGSSQPAPGARSASPRRLSKGDYEALAAFRHSLRVFMNFSEKAAERVGVTARQYQALLAIKGFAGRDRVTVGELADCLLIRHHSAVELVDRLCRAGLAQRETDPVDRRRVLVSLADAAEDLLRDLASTHLEELSRLRPSLLTLLTRLEHERPSREADGPG